MNKILLSFVACCFLLTALNAQTPVKVFMDGYMDDWHSSMNVNSYNDKSNDANGHIDLQTLGYSNDSDNVYFYLRVKEEINLQESNIRLYIDADNNSSTGSSIGGIGAEFTYHFGNKNGQFYAFPVSHGNVGLISLPTHTSREFEIAFSRHKLPDNSRKLFPGDTIRFFIETGNGNGDRLPDTGSLQYVINHNYHAPEAPVVLEKEDTNLLRIMSWNILYDSPFESFKENSFLRLFKVIDADIWAFQEFFNSTATQVKNYMDNIMPTGTAEGWHTVKLDRDNITVSRYPIEQSWVVLQNHNMTASLINLPEKFTKDILIINSHLRCCTANAQRQQEADAIIAFVRDARTTGGRIDLPEGTPIIILGDMNLVGDKQQLLTMLTGDIQDETTFGSDITPDWDGSPLEDLAPYQSDNRLAVTWISETSNFAPGRLDFMLYTGSAMQPQKSYIIETANMSTARLSKYNLEVNDSRVSDHLPLVADYSIEMKADTSIGINKRHPLDLKLYPNPAENMLYLEFTAGNGRAHVKVLNIAGSMVQYKLADGNKTTLDINALAPGLYILEVATSQGIARQKFLKK